MCVLKEDQHFILNFFMGAFLKVDVDDVLDITRREDSGLSTLYINLQRKLSAAFAVIL